MKRIAIRIFQAGPISFLALTAAVAIQAQPLSINGEALQVTVTGSPNDIGSLGLQGTCATLPASFTFQASGLASSGLNPNGTFTENGSFTIDAGPMPGTFVMTAFQATFSFPITNPPGQVSGIKTLNPAGLNQLFSCDSNLLNFNVMTNYTAQIVTVGGTSIDHGSSNVILGDSFTQANNYSFTETFVSTGSQAQTCVAPPSGMLGWWPGDGNTTDIQGGNNGMWVGTAAYAAGEVGSAFSFDGTSYVTIGNPSSLQLTGNQFTLDGWVNPSSIKNDVVYFGKTAYGNNDYVVIFQFNQLTGMMKTGSGEVIIGSGYVPPVNQWTHVAFTYDGSSMNLYVNGALISAAPHTGNLVNDSPEFAIGGRAIDPFGRTFRFPGAIDEVEVFNRALSSSEIQAIYFAGSAGKCKSNTSNGPQATGLAFTSTSATSSDFDDAASVQARLTKTSDGSPVSGKTITFTLGSGPTCSGATDATGTASCSLTPSQSAGSYTLAASFGGDSSFSPSSAMMPFTVTKEETVTKFTLTSPTMAANGSSTTFSATLKEDGTAPIGGRTLTFTLGSGAGAQSCSGATDGTGTASCAIAVNQPSGPNTVKAAFAGDAFYQPSSDMETVTVFAVLAGGGSFVIGNMNATAGSAVTFWGAQWAKANSLSGGPAPDAFKGFAAGASTNPPACGGSWMSAPGDSSNPPAGVPAYMAVLASSSAVKSGASIAGNIAGIVVIKTDPGYAPNPGHAGTGTVVAVLPCH